MRLSGLVLVAALVLLPVACRGSGPTGAPSDAPTASQQLGATSPPSATAIASAHPGQTTGPSAPTGIAQVIYVTLTDALRIEPAQMTVKAGQPVTFRVTNTGALAHEFYVGDETAQAEHEAEMVAMGGTMPHDEPNGIAVQPGETKDLTYTFASPVEWLAGCHVTNHYSGGMRATITVE